MSDDDLQRLREHGDRQVAAGCVDLAVNVEPGPPRWLADELTVAVTDLTDYPDTSMARAAAAARHGRSPQECTIASGAAELFWLLPRALDVRRAACVHPSFTEPEAALRHAGVDVVRVMRRPEDGWLLDVSRVPDDADLVVLGRPDNPTGVVDPVTTIEALCREGRTVVVDEAFTEFLDDADGVAGRSELPGLVSVRSLTKLWGLAGLRVGYAIGPPDTVAALDEARQPWPAATPALMALARLVDPAREPERRQRARSVAKRRRAFVAALGGIEGLDVHGGAANFVLVRAEADDLADRLIASGYAPRRADSFPGLDRHWLRFAVRDTDTNSRVVHTLSSLTMRKVVAHRSQ